MAGRLSSTAGQAVTATRHPFTIAAVLLCAFSSPSASQDLGPGAMPIGVRMTVIQDDYLVSGSTAPEILGQIQALAGRGWTRFPYVYSWRYQAERVLLTNGLPSNFCTPDDFEFEIDATLTYPRWDRPPDAPERLVEAWDAFAGQIEQQWEHYRDGIVERARQAALRMRRYEEQCAFINDRVRERVVEVFRDPDIDEEPLVGLRWPPEGYEDLMRVEAPPTAEPSGDVPPGAGPAGTGAPPLSPPSRPTPEVIPEVTPMLDIDTAVRIDLEQGRATGLAIDLHHLGELAFREAHGRVGPDSEEPLTTEESFAFPSYTEFLIATTAASLAADETIDLEAPLATYLPQLSPRLGTATMSQLLDHRSGLDNAAVPDSADWTEVLDELNDRALFTEPGAVYSYSRYSYPLAARIVEAVEGRPFEEVATTTILEPLGLTETTFGLRDADDAWDGLPVTYTTVADVSAFWTAWLAGEVSGVGPDYLDDVQAVVNSAEGRTFSRGYWQDRIGEAPRLSLMCGSARTGYANGFQILPDTRTILVFWARYDLNQPEGRRPVMDPDRWPKESVRFVLSRVAEAMQLTNEVYRPTALSGGGQPAAGVQRCTEPAVSQRRLTEFGPPAETGDWAGRYLNGEWFFELQDREGFLASPVDPSRAPYSVRHFGGDVYFTDMDIPGGPSIGFPLRIFRDLVGRRYLMLGNRTYLHDDDRVR